MNQLLPTAGRFQTASYHRARPLRSSLMNPRAGESGTHAVHTSLEATQGSWPNSHVPLFSCQNKPFCLIFVSLFPGIIWSLGEG